MAERPILFSGPMVRAILDGRKTQTRRVVKKPENYGCLTGDCPHMTQADCDSAMATHCPYGVPGDRLWARETHALVPKWPTMKLWSHTSEEARVIYRATPHPTRFSGPNGFHEIKWRPSIHMPRWASRITLEVTCVRVERLQDISQEDAEAEGVTPGNLDRIETPDGLVFYDHIGPFHGTWSAIHGAESWFQNPWVWVIEFAKVEAS